MKITLKSVLLKKQGPVYPKSLPFSKSILVIHHLLQRFIKSAFEFCHDLLANQSVELTIELSRSVESLLQRNLRVTMQKQLSRNTTLKVPKFKIIARKKTDIFQLSQILQFITNVTHMERSVRDVEAYIRKVQHSRKVVLLLLKNFIFFLFFKIFFEFKNQRKNLEKVRTRHRDECARSALNYLVICADKQRVLSVER